MRNRVYLPVFVPAVLCILLCTVTTSGSSDSSTTLSLHLVKAQDASKIDISGDGQIGTINTKLGKPIILRVVDDAEKPLADIKVAYKIIKQPSDTRNPIEIIPENEGRSDEEGFYRAECRLGDKPGNYEILFFVTPESTSSKPSFSVIRLTAYKPSWGNWLLMGLLGGLAVFLLGMDTAAQGLQTSSALRLRAVISDMTKRPVVGMGAGALVTFLMQSSTATTTMLVSLVSSRMMTLRQALVIIPGAAIGTTITVQLISFDIFSYALPLIAIGFILKKMSRNRRTIAIGSVILGFGLIFLGMKLMTEVISPLKSIPFFHNAMVVLGHNPFWAIVFSAFFTGLLHSSGATLALVIALASQGSIDLARAIPLIFGANIGTCITAILASLGASREAKRVAWGHLIYKVIGVAIFYPFIPYLAIAAEWFTSIFSWLPGSLGQVSTAREVANTHTIYNLIIAFLFMPFVGRFESLLLRIMPVQTGEEMEVRPKYLELQILETPSIALGSALREMSRMGRFVQEQMRAIQDVVFERHDHEISFIHQRDNKIDQLQMSLTRFLANLTQKNLSEEQLERSIGLLYIVQDLENIGDIIDKNLVLLGEKIIKNDLRFSREGEAELRQLHRQVEEDLSRVVTSCSTWDKNLALEVVEHKEILKHRREEMLLNHLRRMQEGLKETIETSSVHVDIINYFLRIEFYSYRIARVIAGQISLKPNEDFFERTSNDYHAKP